MFLSKADLFGYSLQPTFKGNSKINTVLGGVVSLLLVGLFAVGFFFVGREIVEKKNPISNVSAVATNNAAISLKEIPMFFVAISDEGKFLHVDEEFNKSVTIKATLYEINTSENGEFTYSAYEIPMVFCSEALLGEDYYKTTKASQAGVDYALCLDYNNAVSSLDSKKYEGIPSLKNPFGYQNSAHLNVQLRLCDETVDPNCRDSIKKVSSFSFSASHPQGILNISSNSNPISKSLKSLITSTFLGLSSSQLVNFTVNDLISDEGWVLEENNTQTFFTADPPIYNATQYSETDKIIGRYVFAVNLNKNITTRRYMKLQELVANLGGFIKISMMVFSFLFETYSKWCMYTQIVKIEAQSVLKNSSSGIMINNMFSSNMQLSSAPKAKSHSFLKFVAALISTKKSKEYQINWKDSTKYLDLLYIKSQFEEINSILKSSNLKQKQNIPLK